MSLNAAQSGHPNNNGAPMGISRRKIYVLLAVLVIQLILISPSLMPPFPQINPFDEAKYVISGEQLLHFQIRDLAHGPFVAVLYAPLQIVFGPSQDWFVLETWAGRFILFAFLFLSTIHLGRQFKRVGGSIPLAGVLLVSVPFIRVIANQSDAIFAGLSALALAQLIRFHTSLKTRDLLLGSIFLGLAVLTRAEAILLLAVFPILALIISLRRLSSVRTLIYATAPTASILVAYLLLLFASSGSIDVGFRGKSYNSFELNQPVPAGVSPRVETARIYGTPEQNGGSVLRAIARNPGAFAARLWDSGLTLPGIYLDFFERKQGPVIFVLMVWGILRFVWQKRWMELAIVMSWSLEPLSALPFDTYHIVAQLSLIILLFASFGAVDLTDSKVSKWGRCSRISSFFALAAFGLITGKLALLAGGFVVLSGLLLIELGRRAHSGAFTWSSAPLLTLLAAGIIMRTPFPFPNFPSLGTSSEEQAVHYLEQHVPVNSLVMSPFPGPAVAARMVDIGPGDVPQDARNPEAFLSWVHSKGIDAIYLDRKFKGSADVYNLAGTLARQGDLKVAFTSADGRIRVLFPDP